MHRTFSINDQNEFADLSGDFNPLHVDEIAARRLMFGEALVHGVHGLLWALDTWLESRGDATSIVALRAIFQKPIGLGREVSYHVQQLDDQNAEIQLRQEGDVATVIKLNYASAAEVSQNVPNQAPRCECIERSADDLATAAGSLDLCVEYELASQMFPQITKKLGHFRLSQLLATTRLVGMECPGLHSVYSELHLKFAAELSAEPLALNYSVERCDKRFSMLMVNVDSPGLSGKIKAFIRPAAQNQAAYSELCQTVEPGIFAGQRAVVIGGSRGLGEVTAKLLAAGGAEVAITYCRGKDDAQRIADEINQEGGAATAVQFNVLEPEWRVPDELGSEWSATHLYYFATPHISASPKGRFVESSWKTFNNYYVVGFSQTFEQFLGDDLKYVFFPSSVFVDELPTSMGEYAVAKSAGERLVEFYDKFHADIEFHAPRLPRMATDQTSSFLPVSRREPVDVMLECLTSTPQTLLTV